MAPPLPWRSSAGIKPHQTYVVVTTRLPLRSHRHIPAVLRTTRSLVRELQRSDGLLGYALRAEIARKTFWTMSAWHDDAALALRWRVLLPHGSACRWLAVCHEPLQSVSAALEFRIAD